MVVAASGKQMTYSHLRRRAPWPTLVVGVAILTIAILNPLLCVLHCALSHRHADPRSGEPSLYLCELAGEAQPAAAPFELVWAGPRAIYEVTLPFTVALARIAVSAADASAAPTLPSQHIPGPSSPPPKI
ncbi:hypothetical protein K2Z83_17775 [Oscillochloris sp. ZM17-4]|uniref:hypothetical protein n=1 Tax=Oscillochloris sp. ZM17-4 TaxID=2866714 RepID=UPI001C73DB2C|nr:hypothetical protein [Oscillochloris sp. ZM17-4]MBX0329523.1 hypothetical protein [Oscillochloris sp. ZM17-4]